MISMARIHVGIISVYPKRGEKHTKFSGVASYTKNLVEAISKLERIKISVYANITSKKEEYTESDNIVVIRCWTPIFYPFQIL
ncbi:hypothetical protein, partial [Thermococcus sp.]|uniref:hypothetical protein n=1 Tax=Thermococcus sp. TaxID=35749 RepID=UPI0026130CB7